MMKDELIHIWQAGNEALFGDEKTDRKMITQYLNEKTLKGTRNVKFNLIFYGVLQLANLLLIFLNLAGYAENPSMTWILIPQVALTIGILVFSMVVFYSLREINNYSQSLVTLINKQLWFYRKPYEIWQVLAALSAIILISNVNFFLDNSGGSYVINNSWMYAGVTIGAFLFIYGGQKISSMLGLRNLKAYLSDLQQGHLEESKKMERSRRKFLWLWILLFLLLTASLVAGILAALA
jgi:hypothetical protein